MAKSKHRWKLIRDSVLIRQKLWLGMWARYKYDGMDMINKLKTQHVKLKEELAKIEIHLDLAEQQYKLIVDNLKKSKRQDRQGDSHSDWEVEKEGYWFVPSILCWAKPRVPEPIDFDKRYFVLGHRPGSVGRGRGRDKEMTAAIMDHEKNIDEAKHQMREDGQGEDGEHLLIFREADKTKGQTNGKNWRKRQPGESQEDHDDRLRGADAKAKSRSQDSNNQLK